MKRKKQLSNEEMIRFCDHMSMILKAGLTPAAGIDLLLEDTATKEGRALLQPIAQKCEQGFSFPAALAESGLFPDYALHMIEIGNTTGKLDEVMDSLVYHYSRERNILHGVKNAITYPFLIIAMMLVVIVILVVKILPIFRQVFQRLGTDLTGFSKSLLRFGNVLSTYSVAFFILLAVILILFLFFSSSASGRRIFSRFCSVFILTRNFCETIAAARFSSGMAILLSAGLDVEKCFDYVMSLVDNKRMCKRLSRCRELMTGSEGKAPLSFSAALAESGVLGNAYSKMVGIGFTTGAPDKVFQKIADSYDKDLENRMETTVTLLEPSLVILLSVVVSLILLSVILPLLGVMSTIG